MCRRMWLLLADVVAMTYEAERAQRSLWLSAMPGGSAANRASVLAEVMPPPPGKRPSVQMLSRQLGISGLLEGEETRDDWCKEPSAAELAAIRELRAAADLVGVDGTRRRWRGPQDPVTLQTVLVWLRRFVEVFSSRPVVCAAYNGSNDFRSAAYNEETLRRLGEFIRGHGSVRPGH